MTIKENRGNTDQRLVLPLFISGLADASKLVVRNINVVLTRPNYSGRFGQASLIVN